MSLITFHFGEQVFIPGKALKQAYSVLYNCFGNAARGKKMPPKWKVINDTMLSALLPLAVFATPMVFEYNALWPVAVLKKPLVLENSALLPIAEFSVAS